MSDPIDRLYAAVAARKGAPAGSSRTAKLLATGTTKIAQKLGEEAIEVAIDAATGNRQGVVLESCDLLYQLAVLWAHLDITPEEIWAEMSRRETMMGIAEKLPKPSPQAA
ncbi:MAG TPA: phosphoribosyl-ATP diphosphatase [Aliidongia sp.]|uniref:phosphoribosyl-ATP diphosphatase n=1 Tax=Aliidongia sp. TaxID=1914230 RepID=UPI002DDD8F5F|nr:phosphoribosyl-ATP diphosphatase [Aliidongia sp.]HEV2677790.1 phosphoribosyl-ATP diphosphatase [Aliidongia sp.]